ncbi:hypothetical protein [Streptomyces sp. AA1529]|uniref:hypothetical protein n=1 Tax=Streptomyces sp. AA1529 TaxID=1203257 RepID=UPI003D708D9F
MDTTHTVGPGVGPHTPALPAAVWQPAPPQHHTLEPVTAPAMTLYQVPVPDAVPVQLPDGRTAWARPVEHRLDPAPLDTRPREPMPAWAKAVGMAAASLTALALGSALALRIAAPALGGLVDVLEIAWKVGLVLLVLLFGAPFVARALFGRSLPEDHARPAHDVPQQVVFAPQIDTGGSRMWGRSGEVNIQLGDRNRNKQ